MTLKAADLSKRFGEVEALKSLSFSLEPGSTVALLGPNGAGKSTAIRILVSLLKPDSGTYYWQDEDLLAQPRRIRELVGYVSQEMAIDKVLSGLEFMRFCAGLVHLKWSACRSRAEALLTKLGLADAMHRPAGDYSGGMKRRLDLATALLHQPKILVLDEPTNGLDIAARELVWSLLKDFVSSGGAILLVSHDFREIVTLANQVLILDDGKVVKAGSSEALKAGIGEFVVRLKTAEYMTSSDTAAVARALESWGDSLTFFAGEDAALCTYQGSGAMADLQNRLYRDLEAAGMPPLTLNIQKPQLEDVFRLATGGDR